MNKTIKPGRQVREATLEKIEGDSRTVMLSFASESPVARWYGNEILSCRAEHVDLSRMKDGAPLLFNHDPDELIGVVESASVDPDKVCRALVRISRNCDDVLNDIQDGIIRKVSVGYETKSIVADVPESKESARTVTWDWMPFEISLVSVPADNSVGIGRSASGDEANKSPVIPAEENAMNEKKDDIAAPAVKVEVRDNSEQTRKEASEIVKLCRQHNAPELAERALDKGLSLADVRAELLETVSKRSPQPSVQGKADIGMSDKEKGQYSFLRAIQYLSGVRGVDATLEIEASESASKRSGQKARGLIVPHDVLVHKRDFTVAGTGSNAVSTNLLAGSFIEILRNRLVTQELGAAMLTGLVGDVAIPKHSTATSAYWVTEGNSPTEGLPVLGQVTGTPRTLGAYVDISRKLMKQASVDVEAFVRDDLARVLAIGIDYAAINGTGTEQPVGLLATANINNPSISSAGSATYAEILAFLTDIEADNARVGDMAWAMTPEVWGNLAARARGTGDGFILDANTSTCIGLRAVMSNQLPANTAILGVWNQLVIGMWGGLDLQVDTSSLSTAGGVRVVALQDVDVMVRHAQAFAYNSAVTA